MTRILIRFIPATILAALMVISCTGELNWTGISYPCSANKPCTSGYTCLAGVCVQNGTTDGGGKDDTHDPDSPFRPPIKDVKAAFLYVGPVGDFGWTWAHEQGRLHLKKLGYDTTSAGPVSVKDAPDQIEKFIANGYNLIIGTSHDFLVPMLSKASQHPNTNFFGCSGFETGANLGSYFGRLYQIEWLAGMIAGAMTKTDRVGIIATVAIPEVVRHVNAFANGVKLTNPKAKVVTKWLGNWFDIENEPKVTQALLDLNVDVIHSHTDTSIPLEMIENSKGEPLKTKDNHDVYTIGLNSINACDFGPRTCLTSVYWNWGPILERLVKQVKEGKWDPRKIVWEHLKVDKGDSSFHLADINSKVPGSVRIQVESNFSKLAKVAETGEHLSFEGPLVDVDGKTRLAKGKQLTDKDLLNMCWLVDNVVDGFNSNDEPIKGTVPNECKGDR